MNKKYKHIKLIQLPIRILLCILMSVSLTLTCFINSTPLKAYAYSSPKANVWKNTINSSINTDGSISVSETKIIDITKFVENGKSYNLDTAQQDNKQQSLNSNNENSNKYFSPIVWNFNSFPKKSNVEVSNVKVAMCGEGDKPLGNWESINQTTFLSKWNGNNGPNNNCFAYDTENRQMLCYLDYLNSNEISKQYTYEKIANMTGISDNKIWQFNKAIINLNYTINAAPTIYKDVADFDWIYVSDSWVEDTYDLDLTVTVPVGQSSISSPLGKIDSSLLEETDETSEATERNIYAWGHGSSGGIVDFDNNGIIHISNDKVPGGTDASVRIVFPSSWLTNLSPDCDISHNSQTKLSNILKEESVWQDTHTSEINRLIIPIFVISLCMLLIAASIIALLICKKKYAKKPIDYIKYKKLHPCIKVRLKNWNRELPHDFAACVIHLNELGLISITKSHSGDFKLTLNSLDNHNDKNTDASKNLSSLDQKALDLLFNICADNKSQISIEEFENYAKTRYAEFIEAYKNWKNLLTKSVNEVCNFNPTHDRIRHVFYILAVSIALLSTILGIIIASIIMVLVGLITCIVIMMVANTMRNKLLIYNENGTIVSREKITLSFKNYTETVAEFKTYFINTLEKIEYNKQ